VDWFTHIFAAVALAVVLRRKRVVALALAFGAMAPDLDAIVAPVTYLAPQLWFLDHRTFSHSIVLGLPWALLVTWIVQRPAVLGVWRRVFRLDIRLPMDRTILAPMFAGVLLHIGMDALTLQGPAVLSPFLPTRVELDWFYYTDLLALAFSSVLVVLTLWQLGTPRQRRAVLVALLVGVLATGAWRGVALAGVRAEAPGAATIPTWNPQDWWTWRALPNGTVEVALERAGTGSPVFRAEFLLLAVTGQGSPPWDISRERAIAEATWDFTSFSMNVDLVALNATEAPSGTWRLAYFDPVRRAQAMFGGSESLFPPGDLVVSVAPDGSTAVEWR
jgi:membrane-bound metal-dependent hydrolase YbcI (DUF457 family)